MASATSRLPASAGRVVATAHGTTMRRFGVPVEWACAEGLTTYPNALAAMDERVAAIRAGTARERAWLIEHPPLYTMGTSAAEHSDALPLPVFAAGRGGQVTFHGPGQRVIYLMLDLRQRALDVRAFVAAIEEWVIEALSLLGVRGERRDDRVGIWVPRPDKPAGADGSPAEDKIAAIGIRLRHWISLHGVSLNVAPDLSSYDAIVPCGIKASHLGVTSLADLGITASMAEVDAALHRSFRSIFGDVD